jgi:hypothetical protein
MTALRMLKPIGNAAGRLSLDHTVPSGVDQISYRVLPASSNPPMTQSLPPKATAEWFFREGNGPVASASVQCTPSSEDQTSFMAIAPDSSPPISHSLSRNTATAGRLRVRNGIVTGTFSQFPPPLATTR